MGLTDWFRKKPRPYARPGKQAKILRLSAIDFLTLQDAYSGILITGATGSGKTTSSSSHLACGLARQPNISFFVMCVKPDEGKRMETLFRHAGVEQPIFRITPGSPFGFDPIAFEMERSGSAPAAARMLSAVVDIQQRGKGQGHGGDMFWAEFANRILEMAIGATFLGEGRTSLRAVQRFILGLPANLEEAGSAQWRESDPARALRQAEERSLSPIEQSDHQAHLDFVFSEWVRTPDKTKFSCLPMIQNLLGRLTSGPIGAFTAYSNLSPRLLAERRCILILDYPVLADPVGNKAIQVMTYMALVQECLRRPPDGESPAVVFWADEYSYLAVPDYDFRVQSVFRQAKCIAVRIVQDFQLLRKSLGGGDQGTMEADSIINNMATWICHANGDPTTNHAIADRIGKVPVRMRSGSVNLNGFNLFDYTFAGQKPSVQSGWSEVMEYLVRPESFVAYKKGGKANGFTSDVLILTQGNPFLNGQNFLHTQFPQVLL